MIKNSKIFLEIKITIDSLNLMIILKITYTLRNLKKLKNILV